MTKQETFQKEIKQMETAIAALEKHSSRFSTGRLFTFFLATAGFGAALYERHLVWALLGTFFLLAFLYLLHKHQLLEDYKNLQTSRKTILQKHLDRFGTAWQNHEETGIQYLADDFPPGKDLDLFGKASLFQYLSAANTPWGKDTLAQFFNQPPTREEILSRQEAVQELAAKRDFSLHLQTLSHLLGQKQETSKETLAHFFRYGESSQRPWPAWYRFFFWGLPVLTFLALFLGLARVWPLSIFIGCLFVQLLLAILTNKKISAILLPLASFRRSIRHYAQLLTLLEKEDFTSSYLVKLQKPLLENGGASQGLEHLAAAEKKAGLRFHPFAYGIACGLLMWNFHTVENLESWKSLYGRYLRTWLEAVGQIEALLSLTTICFVKENYCFPQIQASPAPLLQCEKIAHPLIEESRAIPNSLTMAARTCVITGSNMSGKTTFLRSIGVNLILAYAGAPVCAQNLTAAYMKIFSSIRIEDNVSQGISTFYAEILRIKTMVEYSGEQKPMLALIDEIYKGTNSADRIIGAAETLKRLTQPWIISLVSTHDFELCDLAGDSGVKALNYHFSEHYEDDRILFDYTLKPGRCRTTNAQYLMRMAGICD